MKRPTSLAYLRLALTAFGLGVSGYLTLLHYDTSVPLVCGRGSFVDCHTVLSSPSSMVLGVPVALWGLVWFVVALGLAVPSVSGGRRGARGDAGRVDPARGVGGDDRSRAGGDSLHAVRLAWTLVGAATVLWLVYQEVGVIGKLCAWCTAVHVTVLALLVVEVRAHPSASGAAAVEIEGEVEG